MSFFGKNIRKIRTIKKLSQSSFADIFELKRASVGAYEEGRSEAKIDTIIQIAKYFSLTIEQLVAKELTVNDITHFNPSKPAQIKAKNGNSNLSILLIKLAIAKNYIKEISNKEYLENLPRLSIPRITESGMRAFEHGDCDMSFAQSGITKGDILIAKKVKDINSIEINKIYVFVLKNEIITRRLVSFDTEIVTKTNTTPFKIKAFDKEEILECWEVKYNITNSFDNVFPLEQRFNDLERKIDKVLKK